MDNYVDNYRDLLDSLFSKDDQGNNKVDFIERKYRKGHYIYMAEDAADRLYYIRDGRVKIGILDEENDEFTKYIRETGDIFGDLSLLGFDRQEEFALALIESRISVIPKKEVQRLIEENEEFAKFWTGYTGHRLRDMEKRFEDNYYKNAQKRLVGFLLEKRQKHGKKIGSEWVINHFMTHGEIGNLTSTSRQTVTMVFNQLKDESILTFNRKRVIVHDMDRFEKLA